MLLSEMGYFSKVVVKGQKLKDMDISVHCDIAVFRWLITWAQHHSKIRALEDGPSNSIMPLPGTNLKIGK